MPDDAPTRPGQGPARPGYCATFILAAPLIVLPAAVAVFFGLGRGAHDA